MEQKIYSKGKSLRDEGQNEGEEFRLVFLKTIVVLLISLFIVIAAKAQAPAGHNGLNTNLTFQETNKTLCGWLSR
ncbi:MAG: hypothetical protein M3R17_13045 [Bacteroidota bacterium]|nr:hypothetical protein [Bacteroidota bacterium]